MRARCSSANIWWRRSAASGAISRARPSSSAWSARRCTASSRRWESASVKSMSRIAYVNGLYLPHSEAAVSIEDRGFQFADGVYEVCEVRGGRLVDERRHMARLDRSLRELRMARPMPAAALAVVMRETVRRNRVRDGIVYVQVTRGAASRDFPFPPNGTHPTLVITARNQDPAKLAKLAEHGIAV